MPRCNATPQNILHSACHPIDSFSCSYNEYAFIVFQKELVISHNLNPVPFSDDSSSRQCYGVPLFNHFSENSKNIAARLPLCGARSLANQALERLVSYL